MDNNLLMTPSYGCFHTSGRRIKASMRSELNKKLFLREDQKYLELKVCKKSIDKIIKIFDLCFGHVAVINCNKLK